MKKVFGILLAVCLLLTSSVSLADGQKLVLITATASDNLDVLIPAFEAATGIDVELITASTGEVYSRIQNETNNPSADVTWISASYVSRDTSFFTPYVSVHNDELPEGFRTQDGYINYVNFTMPVLLVNKNLVDIEIKGYKDLLDPSLFGKIAHGDAAASSSAYNHIEICWSPWATEICPPKRAGNMWKLSSSSWTARSSTVPVRFIRALKPANMQLA